MTKTSDSKLLRHEEARHALARMVMRMGFTWNDHHLEHGIDAFVELTDPTTRHALGAFVGVQIKTVLRFDAESDTEFSYYVAEADLTYWRESRMPVVLIVGRPSDDLFYAVHVQDYFKAQAAGVKTIRFNKTADRFVNNDEWQRRLLSIGSTFTRGLAFPPRSVPEDLITNLLETILPDRVFSAPTSVRYRKDVFPLIRNTPATDLSEFVIKDGLAWSPLNLGDPLVSGAFAEPAKATSIPFADLAFHADPAKRRYVVELLHLCLTARLRRESVRWFKDIELFIYCPHRTPSSRVSIDVESDAGTTKQGVLFPSFRADKIVRCRHVALMTDFVTIGRRYYLQINPTCYFTRNGEEKHPRHEELLQSLKIMQKQLDYHRSLFLWRTLLTRRGNLVESDYPFISFGDFLRPKAPASINDAAWQKTAESDDSLSEQDMDALLK